LWIEASAMPNWPGKSTFFAGQLFATPLALLVQQGAQRCLHTTVRRLVHRVCG
jgi:hypothetical protein